jgi:glutamate N-acetyltransferase/amino-acid N-acetyltransferase
LKLPLGFQYASAYAGIRKVEKDDLALIVSDSPAEAAAVFTTNRVQAAPVRLCKKHLRASGGKVRAILINAGNANCATRTGDAVAAETSRAAAAILGCKAEQVLPASTGVIGVELDPTKITAALPKLAKRLSPRRFLDVAGAIMTTDTVRKTSTAEVSIGGKTVRIAGMTKGAGMIHPNMATTLAFVMTDARVPAAPLKAMLSEGNRLSYSSLSVDGDMSTNDTLTVMANGASGASVTAAARGLFQEVLTHVLQELASQIARDGEGARKLITIHVSGASTDSAASRIARAIANSPLVKTAIAGADPNWGRIICAAGYSGAVFSPSKVDILLQGVPVCHNGLAAEFGEAELTAKLKAKDVKIDFRIAGKRQGTARFWTCDLTEGYIGINGSYRT